MSFARLILQSIGFGAVLTSIVGSPRWGWVYPVAVASLAAAFVLLLLERRARKRQVRRR